MEFLQPANWVRPKGYTNGVACKGRMIFVSGMIAWDGQEKIVSDDLAEQVRQSLGNIVAVLAEANAQPEHIVRLTWYITSRDEYHAELKEIGAAYRAVMGRHFPAMSVVQVVALMEAQAKVEIEATAVIPHAR